jgi:VWFA-related protein
VPESHGGTEGKRPLERLAEPTGGRVFSVSHKMPLERVFAEIADEMRHQYSLGFTPESHDAAFHKLEVKVKRPGMKPAARNGYYAR